jgi:hypothetical protein
MHIDNIRGCVEECERFLERANEILQVAESPDAQTLFDEHGWALGKEPTKSLRRRSLELSDSLRALRRSS